MAQPIRSGMAPELARGLAYTFGGLLFGFPAGFALALLFT